jgi:CRP/FNR family transcriptional regulator, nitrogen fixation regulation protein
LITLYPCDDSDVRVTAPSPLRLEKDSPIYHEGDPAGCWYEVVSGVVRTCRYLANGQRHLTAFYYADDAFGLDLGCYQETAETVTDVLLRRHTTRVNVGTERRPSPGRDDMLEKAWEKARQSIFLFGHKTAANRVAAFILAVSERSEAAGLELLMSRSDIADHLNLTLHTVSRTISELARRKLIALHGRQSVRILDVEGLRIAAGDADRGADRLSPSAPIGCPWPTA